MLQQGIRLISASERTQSCDRNPPIRQEHLYGYIKSAEKVGVAQRRGVTALASALAIADAGCAGAAPANGCGLHVHAALPESRRYVWRGVGDAWDEGVHSGRTHHDFKFMSCLQHTEAPVLTPAIYGKS